MNGKDRVSVTLRGKVRMIHSVGEKKKKINLRVVSCRWTKLELD